MDTEFKLARVADEFLQFGKDGLFFQSAESNTMFILTADLKGYTRENIKINIDEKRNKMVITCEKPVQETVKVGWRVIKNDVEIRKFTKAFKIPVGVILDKIETNFNKEASILTITMPKRVEGILGTGIQEVKEPENLPFGVDKIPKRATFHEDKGAEFSSAGSESTYRKGEASQTTEMQPGFPSNIHGIQEVKEPENLPSRVDEIPKRATFHEDKGAEFSSAGSESAYRKGEASQETEMQPGFPSNIHGIQVKEPENLPFRVDEIPKRATFHEDKGAEFSSAGSESAYRKGEASQETEMQPGFPSNIQKSHEEVEKRGAKDEVPQRETEKPKAEPKIQKIEDMGDGKLECTNLKDDKICEKANGIEEEEEDKLPERRSKICVPVIAGSAIILSLVVFAIHFMRKKNQPGRRKE